MKTYLVGGAVRDMVMGDKPKDHDFVVVGSTPEEMLSAGFEKVGADFPVFLHPDTGNEYALARREKKTGTGYLGFTSEFGTGVTLEEDLGRRDLTINSMAMEGTDFEGENFMHLIDPYNGYDDVTDQILRHTSNAFEEDPVRVLRVARFRARFGCEWKVAPETRDLIHAMAKKGVLNELTAERMWKELSRALMEPYPRLFFDTLLECDALHVLFPEVYALCSAMESRKWHPEGNAYEHTMLVLTQSANLNFDLETRFAALVHDFGKGLTRKEDFPKHYGHDVNGVPVVKKFSDRLNVPSKMRVRAMKATRFHMNMHKLDKLNPKTFVKMFDEMDSQRDPETVNVLYRVGICDERGRLGSETVDINHLSEVVELFEAYKTVRFDQVFPNKETDPKKIVEGMRRARIAAVANKRSNHGN